MSRDTLTDVKDGDLIEPILFNRIHAVLRRLLRLDAAPPLSLSGWATGADAPQLALLAPTPVIIVKLVGSVAAASGDGYTTGTAKIMADTGTALEQTSVEIRVKNLQDVSWDANSRAFAAAVNGSYWLLTPQGCADLGT